jgi:hypothetical protein
VEVDRRDVTLAAVASSVLLLDLNRQDLGVVAGVADDSQDRQRY